MPTEPKAITPNSYVSIGLVLSLVVGALFYGRQLERLDRIESELQDVRSEIKDLTRTLRPLTTGR